MAITQCRDCRGKVSTEAVSCPHCGRPMKPAPSVPRRKASAPTRIGCLPVLGLLFFGVCVASQMGDWGKKDSRSGAPKQKTEPAPVPDLNAAVTFSGGQFTIVNADSFDWTDCKLKVNSGFFSGGYVLRAGTLRSGETYTVGAMQFAKSDGERFSPFSHKVQLFSIRCDTPKGRAGYYGGWE